MQFIDKLNEATNNKYDFLRISKLNLDVGANSLSVVCLLPQDITDDKFSEKDKKVIEEFCRSQVPSSFALKIAFVKNLINQEAISKQVFNFISLKYQTILTQMDPSMTDVRIEADRIVIDIYVFSTAQYFCENSGLKEKLAKHIFNQNCVNKVVVNIKVCKAVDTDKLLKEREDIKYVDNGEIEIVGDYHYLVGKDINRKPRYIEKYKKEMDGICVCGTVSELKRINIIDKKSPDRRLKNILFKFVISDSTGKMDCIYFAKIRKPKKGEREHTTCLDMLKEGDDVVILGNYKYSDFSDKNELTVVRLALCKINYDALAKRREDIKLANKIKIFQSPKAYEVDMNDSLLDLLGHCDYIMNNKFVVFDLETTGLNTETDDIIELGAVKLEEGKIVEYYNTLVDPKRSIPEGASKVNNIYDADVKNAPYIEDVFGFFVDYCKGYVLVAHNGAGFDFKIIKRVAGQLGYPLYNEMVDSLTEARNVLPGSRRHSLEALCDHYGIVNRNAHRAYEDAEATAKVFVKLMDDKFMTR
ncbi:MAG: 3'-5' exoribonuclease [Clostridia bacterium]|nr:3'-5' exoribonuclease [Clostridia bacterium]